MSFFEGSLGALHTGTAAVSLLAGAVILGMRKGTPLHRKLGYTYVACMIGLNLSAIPIQRLYGGFGPFHIFILISLPTVLAALYYPLFARAKANWMQKHMEFMYWSYVGLIAAFVNEVIVRLPLLLADHPAGVVVAGGNLSVYVIGTAVAATGAVMAAGEYVFRVYRRRLAG